jgi:hypothetical protein
MTMLPRALNADLRRQVADVRRRHTAAAGLGCARDNLRLATATRSGCPTRSIDPRELGRLGCGVRSPTACGEWAKNLAPPAARGNRLLPYRGR